MPEPAYAHYRVERETSDDLADRGTTVRRVVRRWGPRALGIPLPGGPPMTTVARDVVRILDREGRTAFERHLDDHRASERLESEIKNDLLALDVERFRARYAIA